MRLAKTVALCIACLGATPAFAETGSLELELNTAKNVASACRLTFVAVNNSGVALTKTSYEMAVFDQAGAVSTLLVLEFGEQPLNKTSVVEFDLPDTSCDKIARIIVNRQVDCASASGTHDVCMKALIATSRLPEIGLGQ